MTTPRPIAGSTRPAAFALSDGSFDMTGALAAELVVHRYVGAAEVDHSGAATSTPETWMLVLDGARTTTSTLVAGYTPSASGAGSWGIPGQTIKVRMRAKLPGPIWIEASAQTTLGPVQEY